MVSTVLKQQYVGSGNKRGLKETSTDVGTWVTVVTPIRPLQLNAESPSKVEGKNALSRPFSGDQLQKVTEVGVPTEPVGFQHVNTGPTGPPSLYRVLPETRGIISLGPSAPRN